MQCRLQAGHHERANVLPPLRPLDHQSLVQLELDAHIAIGWIAAAQRGGQSVVLPGIGIIASYPQHGVPFDERRLPARRQLDLSSARRIVEQACIGSANLAVEDGGEAV